MSGKYYPHWEIEIPASLAKEIFRLLRSNKLTERKFADLIDDARPHAAGEACRESLAAIMALIRLGFEATQNRIYQEKFARLFVKELCKLEKEGSWL